MKRICLVGATGLVGTALIEQAVDRADVRIVGVARREAALPPGARMEMLIADLKAHHTDVAEKIIGSVVVDAHHTTENQLLAKARNFYAECNRK